jgi:hypothetical protein
MKLPRDLGIHTCFNCKNDLLDDNFKRCGISLERPQLFFDYECSTCEHSGRYYLELLTKMGPVESLIFMATLIEAVNIQKNSVKGNIKQQLNKITGVQDLLRLGGTDAPREQTRRDDTENLP